MCLALLLLSGLLLDILHLSLDGVLFPVVSDNALQGLGILNPLYETCISTQGDDCVGSKSQISLSCFWVIIKHSVAQHSEVDESLLLSEVSILVTFEQEVVILTIRTNNSDLFGLLLRVHDGHFGLEAGEHDWILFVCRKLWRFKACRDSSILVFVIFLVFHDLLPWMFNEILNVCILFTIFSNRLHRANQRPKHVIFVVVFRWQLDWEVLFDRHHKIRLLNPLQCLWHVHLIVGILIWLFFWQFFQVEENLFAFKNF